MRLTPSTSLQSVRERLGVGDAETLRESEKRRRYLQTFARLLSSTRPSVRFADDLRTATTDYDGSDPEITVTTRAFDQPVTDFRRRVFDLVVQEALVVHEVGHLHYTDNDSFRTLLARADPERRRLFSRLWNTLEDGAIERQLRHRYAVAPELEVLNANLFQAGSLARESPAVEERRFSLFQAVITGLADMAIYDSGRFRRLRADDATLRMASLRDQRVLGEFRPTMRETVETVLTEPDPAARNEHIWSFWQALVDVLETSTVSGAEASELARLLDADGTVRTDQGDPRVTRRTTDATVLPETGAGAPLPGKPDDTGGEFGPDTRTARDLARDTVAEEVDRQLESVLGSDGHDPTTRETAETGDEPGASDTSQSGAGTDDTSSGASEAGTDRTDHDGPATDGLLDAQSHPGAGQLPGERRGEEATAAGGVGSESESESEPPAPEERATSSGPSGTDTTGAEGDATAAAWRRRYTSELAAETSELDSAEARLDELESYVHALDAMGDDAALQVVTEAADGGTATADRWSAVRRDAKLLAERFRSRLREQRRDAERSRRRRGSLDRSRLIAASRGRPDVFTQTEESEDRAYTCVVVLDRSGSMNDGAVTAAERGATSAAVALEAVGVDVTVLDLHDSTVRLVKTTAEATREARRRVLTGNAGGGTPLAQALSLARTRFEDAENPFVLVVTDGLPDDEAAYTTQLDASTFPVLGVYLRDPDRPDGRSVEADRSYFHQLAVVEDWGTIDQRLQGLAGRVLF
ncbi:VWA domain-containing protein [Halorientalis sp.]|uniref:VWA domain-containing protein n=1 Tax=Halorientalis sp. TaxID=1931229 RepID=UPI002622658F|nr:VWA domain-containing protein [Halorientalis sp.]